MRKEGCGKLYFWGWVNREGIVMKHRGYLLFFVTASYVPNDTGFENKNLPGRYNKKCLVIVMLYDLSKIQKFLHECTYSSHNVKIPCNDQVMCAGTIPLGVGA